MKPVFKCFPVAALFACGAVHSAELGAAETRFQIGLSAVTGMSELEEAIEINNPGLSVSTISPIGISFAVFHNFGGGFGIGATVGPVIRASGDISFTVVPIGLDVRYQFSRGETMSPYVRAGMEKALVSGHIVESGSVGAVVALGVVFGRNWGVEAAYRSTPVDVTATRGRSARETEPYQGTLSVVYSF